MKNCVVLTRATTSGWQAGGMVRRDGVGPPRDYVTRSGAWPQGPFRAGTPHTVRVAADIVTRLREAIEEMGLTNAAAAEQIGISRQALQDILGGRSMPDLHTLVQAQDSLEYWPWPEG